MENQVKWILQENTFNEDLDSITNEISSQGMEYKIVKYIPFLSGVYKDLFDPNDCVIYYGSINLMSQIQKEFNYPVAWFDMRKLNCTYYYSKLGKYLVNQIHTFTTVSDILRMQDFFFETFVDYGLLFLRPNENTKSFNGTVVDRSKLKALLHDCQDEDLIVVTIPRNIYAEWRLVCVNKEVVTGSQYRKDGKLFQSKEVPNPVIDLGNEICKTWLPDDVCVIDIGLTSTGYQLIELGSVNVAGLYMIDRPILVSQLSQAAIERRKKFEP